MNGQKAYTPYDGGILISNFGSGEETDSSKEQSEEDNRSLGGMEGTAQQSDHAEAVVYMTTDISPEGLMTIYESLDGLTGNMWQ